MSPMRTLLAGLAAVLVCASAPSNAKAAETVKLKVGFSPNHLGASTTILVSFAIQSNTSALPSPLTNFNLGLPRGMGLGITTLGEVTCVRPGLEAQGVSGCSGNSLMGLGEAVADVEFGSEILEERAKITLLMGPPVEHHTTLLFFADAQTPAVDEEIFQGQLLPGAGPNSAQLTTAIPIMATVPDGPDVSIVAMHSSLGPRGVTYHRFVNGKRAAYTPIGMTVPNVCPRGGWLFAATFTFLDGSAVTATSRVACPRARERARH